MAVVAYFGILAVFTAIAIVLYKGFRAVGLI
ncbi:cytochrome b6-f complex subunit PetL [Spirulina sp. CCNP1310]|nr:cytochrome b6-f complex subunit PetL [Spirulina sp. CCNP1310]MEA5421241.1 cytochrome b6-f complex subunit PetL [Spirulina sp. CCNP1310]